MSQSNQSNRRFVRDLFSGQVREVHDNPNQEFETLNQASREKTTWMTRKDRQRSTAYDLDWVSEALAVPNAQAAEFNELSRLHGTGARYVPDEKKGFARLHCGTKGSRAREMRLRGTFDRDGGYSDYCGSF